ncbi:MAG: hypothetical protein DRO14_06035 [Thermoprotei archaeon]|nr:MAG: hypothetical protein DRO14_06035 [Thermoprotei archaeon]
MSVVSISGEVLPDFGRLIKEAALYGSSLGTITSVKLIYDGNEDLFNVSNKNYIYDGNEIVLVIEADIISKRTAVPDEIQVLVTRPDGTQYPIIRLFYPTIMYALHKYHIRVEVRAEYSNRLDKYLDDIYYHWTKASFEGGMKLGRIRILYDGGAYWKEVTNMVKYNVECLEEYGGFPCIIEAIFRDEDYHAYTTSKVEVYNIADREIIEDSISATKEADDVLEYRLYYVIDRGMPYG